MSISFILVVILILLLIGSFPNLGFSYNAGWGYRPFSFVGVVLVVVIVLVMLGRI